MKEKAFSQEPGFRTLAATMLMVAVPLVAGLLLAESPGKFSLLAVAAVILVILTARYPEVIFALFLNAGEFKGDPRFQIPFIDTTVFLGILTALGLFLTITRQRTRLAMPPLKMSIPFLLICLISALSLTYTSAPVYGTDKFFRFVTLTGLAFFGAFYLLRGNDRCRNFMATYILVAIAMVVDVLQKSPMPGTGEVAAFSSNYLSMGYVMASAFIMLFMYFFMVDKSSIRRAFYLLAPCLATLYVLMISGARGPFIALVITLLVIIVIARRPHSYSSRMTFWVFALLSAAGVYLSYNYQEFTRMTGRMTMLEEGGGVSALTRIYMAESAFKAMTTMPYFLIGLGIGGFQMYYFGFDSLGNLYRYPHNILLELGSETGIVGLISIVMLLYWSYRKAYSLVKRATGNNYHMAVTVFSVFIFGIINALKSGDINDHRLLFAMVGLIYSLDRDVENNAVKKTAPEVR